MGAIATYVYADWIAGYPQFSACTSGQGQAWFNQATLVHANDGSGPVQDAGQQAALLYALTSHLGWLNAPRDASGQPAANGTPPPPLVGRISNASQGASSAAIEWNGSGSPSEAWFTQTQFGAFYWQATARYRTMRYRANPVFVPTTAFPGRFPGRRW